MDEQLFVYFIRHGMTRGNLLKQYTGWSNPPLLPEEHHRLKHAAAPVVDEVWCSDLKRATETAEILFPDASLKQSWMLREMHFGDFEGKDYQELKHQARYQYWLDNMKERGPANGETLVDVHYRIQHGWERIKHTKNKRVAVVTHSGWIREWCNEYVPDHSLTYLWQIPYGAGILAIFQKNGGEWECRSLQEAPLMEKKSGY
ncbi:phosphoglycerate mutase family protein [Salibacterium salarium]|uniref:Phosphoglycerate mutase family protein n=1 Tax=Salibacterium salarium TaxID=284579 RepID=A0A428N0U5_9BACI|nr:phosphoglycerate mutase family protein [Salibacterium salarium]RSL32065.1 phosphoglycerate mutase family protein [Salibacterium salarium]